MNTSAEKTQENKSQAVANNLPKLQNYRESIFHFADNRPEAITQRKMQEAINNSLSVKQLEAYQEMANNSPQVRQLGTYQLIADESVSVPIQKPVLPSQPIQKKDINTNLPDRLKSGIEVLSGISMNQVKVHFNSSQPAQLNAMAYAQGNDIHVAPGQERHLPHEAWHVVQQAQGRVRPTMQMKDGGVPINDDKELELEADVMGEKALTSPEPHAGPPTPLSLDMGQSAVSNTVQRIVRLNGDNVLPEQHAELIAGCRAVVEANTVVWTQDMENMLLGWLGDPANIIAAANAGVLASNLYQPPADLAWRNGMTITAIPAPKLEAASHLRQIDRFSLLMEPHATQTSKSVPGLGKLDNEELLRLGEHGREEEQYWVRPSTTTDPKRIMNAKRKGISAEDEAHITASGLPEDPSYVVATKDHQLGHRYRGTDQQFIKGESHKRSYGSKKKREGYEYKGSGLVDGHSVQVQDDQPILGPFKAEATAWKSTVKKTDGSTVTYDDSAYLPDNEKDEQWIEKHPHNFYWENQEQGKHMRQKAIEAPTMKGKTSFLHYNRYTGDSFNPNKGKASSHIYDVPSRIDYLTKDKAGARTHYSADNRPEADYSRPASYDQATRKYADVPGGKPSHKLNRTLGPDSAFTHLDRAKMPDTSTFPSSTVLAPEDPAFKFAPAWRSSVSGYQSPPRSPYYAEDGVEETAVSEPGDESLKKHFRHGDGLVSDSVYDKAKNETAHSVKKLKKAKAKELTSGKEKFAEVHAGKAKVEPAVLSTGETASASLSSLASIGTTTGTTGTSAPRTPLSKEAENALRDYRRSIDHLNNAMTELNAALSALPALDAQRATLLQASLNFAAIDRDDITQNGDLQVFYQWAVNWMFSVQPHLTRHTVGGGMGEPANNALGGRGRRMPALQQFFNECGQMAAQNVIALAGGADTEGFLNTLGTLEQDIDEDQIRTIINNAGRPDLPVVSNLNQVQQLVALSQANNIQGLADLHIGGIEQAGLISIGDFITGNTGVLNLLLNTVGHKFASGHHWIAVQLTWEADDQVQINYRDSYGGDMDYTELFAGLRAFVGAVPVNVPAVVGGGEASGKGKTGEKS